MGIKRITENPTIADTIIFDILTPNEVISGIELDSESPNQPECFEADPFKVDDVKIFYIERDFTGENIGETEISLPDLTLQQQLEAAKSTACDSPTEENIATLQRIKNEFDLNSKKEIIRYKDAVSVGAFGNGDTYPAWLSTDQDNAILNHIVLDSNGNTQYGHFELEWDPLGMREGDYFICWTWTPLPAGDKFSAHQFFRLGGSTQLTTSIPTHFTNPDKYSTLLDRYTPEMYKVGISNNDVTKYVIDRLNHSVADGFTVLEDLTNQIVDIIDANATHESILQLLGNTFNLKLRTNDPTLWRRQIKNAVPLFKQKGTLPGLTSALSAAGIALSKFTEMWQVVSPYTFQEAFDVEDEEDLDFTLSKNAILPVDPLNFELFYRGVEDLEWTELSGPTDYVNLSEVGGKTIMTWVGSELSVSPIILEEGDSIRVIYEVVEVPNPTQQTIEEYIRTLPLSDLRDDRDQNFPLKNWNVRLIEEDDALFDVIIPTRHPFVEELVFGKIRTEFPYSENVYNMEEYNGSRRNSTNPCDIDRGFLDACSSCKSSKYNVDLEIEDLSNRRILEAEEVLREHTPFHNILHSMTLTGTQNDFVQSPVETLEGLLTISGQEIAVVDPPQTIFSRTMTNTSQIKRNALASVSTVVSSASGTGSNQSVVLFAPDFRMDRIPLSDDSSLTYLEILSPHAHAGSYTVQNPTKNHLEVNGVTEPITQSSFTFRLSIEAVKKTSTDITQDDLFVFSDESLSYSNYNVKSQWDVDNDSEYSGGAWKVSISTYSDVYDILEVLPNGSLVLNDPSATLPTVATNGIIYNLLNDSSETITSSTSGSLIVNRRGRVDLGTAGSMLIRGSSTTSLDDVRNVLEIGYFMLYSGTQYFVSGFATGETKQFYIDGYSGGTVSGVSVTVYQRIASNEYGVLHLKGLELTTLVDHETGLGILNGANAPADENDILEDDLFKENFLVLINSEYFAISEIDGTTITLSGPQNDWNTTGTAVTYDILKYSKLTGTTVNPPTGYRYDPVADIPEREYPPVPGYAFEFLDRRGNEVIEINTENAMPMMAMSALLNAGRNDDIMETVGQEEKITFSVEWKEEE